jgi:hypothetical protein
LGGEPSGFISDSRISEPTRRIQGKNHYLFGIPGRNPVVAMELLESASFPCNSRQLQNLPSTHLEMIPIFKLIIRDAIGRKCARGLSAGPEEGIQKKDWGQRSIECAEYLNLSNIPMEPVGHPLCCWGSFY